MEFILKLDSVQAQNKVEVDFMEKLKVKREMDKPAISMEVTYSPT